MKARIRHRLVRMLYDSYKHTIPFRTKLLSNHNIHLDHFAIIDLPSENSGIHYLQNIFSKLGFIPKGSGYLPSKQNSFIWMREEGFNEKLAKETIAQAVIADFKLCELPARR